MFWVQVLREEINKKRAESAKTLHSLSVQIRSPDDMTQEKYNEYYPSKNYLNSFILCIIMKEQIESKSSIVVKFHFLFLSFVSFFFLFFLF